MTASGHELDYPDDSSHVEATAAATPRARRRLSDAGQNKASKSQPRVRAVAPAPDPRTTLRVADLARSRIAVLSLAAFMICAAIAPFFVGGDRMAKQLAVAGLVTGAAVCLWFVWLIRDPDQYTTGRTAALSYFALLTWCGTMPRLEERSGSLEASSIEKGAPPLRK
ncbi:MAG: hypothetical protein AAGC55_09890, partial [Myxococcota bacterium]